MYGMTKTTVYLPDDLKRALEAEAGRRGSSEAEVIRDAIRRAVASTPRRPHGALFAGREPIAERADELLRGFGV
jgi:predicted transcriptional regulator